MLCVTRTFSIRTLADNEGELVKTLEKIDCEVISRELFTYGYAEEKFINVTYECAADISCADLMECLEDVKGMFTITY